MDVPEWLTSIRSDVAVFGVSGAIISFALKPTRKLAPAFVQVFGGFIVAVTGTPYVNYCWPIPTDPMYAGIAFLLGISGLGVIRGISKFGPTLFFKTIEMLLSMKKDGPR